MSRNRTSSKTKAPNALGQGSSTTTTRLALTFVGAATRRCTIHLPSFILAAGGQVLTTRLKAPYDVKPTPTVAARKSCAKTATGISAMFSSVKSLPPGTRDIASIRFRWPSLPQENRCRKLHPSNFLTNICIRFVGSEVKAAQRFRPRRMLPASTAVYFPCTLARFATKLAKSLAKTLTPTRLDIAVSAFRCQLEVHLNFPTLNLFLDEQHADHRPQNSAASRKS